MGRPAGPKTRILSVEDRGGSGPNRYRVRYLLNGGESFCCFATSRQAQGFVEKFDREKARTAGQTVALTINTWLTERAANQQPCPSYYKRLVTTCLEDILDQPIAAITGPAMIEGWTRYADTVAGATARQALKSVRVFGKWLVKKKLVLANPASEIEFSREIKKGKPQIETVRELYAFRDEVWRSARAGDRASLGVLIGLYLGLRSAEVQALQARHVDLHQRLVIPGTKSDAARRTVPVKVPELWALLDEAAKQGGRIVPCGRDTLIRRVRAAAKAGKVANHEELCFHSLRGMAASLATENGAAFDAIARGLGHVSYEGITAKHYATKDSQEAAASSAALSVLQGNPSSQKRPN